MEQLSNEQYNLLYLVGDELLAGRRGDGLLLDELNAPPDSVKYRGQQYNCNNTSISNSPFLATTSPGLVQSRVKGAFQRIIYIYNK